MVTIKRRPGAAVVIPPEGNWHKGSGGIGPARQGRQKRPNLCQVGKFRVDNGSDLDTFEGMVEELAETQTRPRIEANFRKPTLNDGQSLWRMARDSQVLDLNSSYSYLLWTRDFAETSIIATVDGEPAGFITGYMRPDEPGTLMVWQVAVDQRFRGRRLAADMLDRLAWQVLAERVETTITADNEASVRLFAGFASRREAPMEREPLFTEELYPDGHDTEYLFRIGPLN